MKLNYFLFLFLAITTHAYSQNKTSQDKNEAVFQLVKRYFNAKQTDSIYSLAGEKFKQQIPLETFKIISSNQLYPVGKIKESSFIT